MKIVIDAMGGDNAPRSTVEGAVLALKNFPVEIVLTGDKEKIEKALESYEYDKSRLEIIHTTQKIENEDKPVKAIRSKKDSSMVVGLNLVKDKKADGIVSAGNTGALLAGGLFVLGRLKGIDRPALCSYLPTREGVSILIDAGANADCKPQNILEFGMMGSAYARGVLKLQNPKVGIVNIGAEEGKGNELTKKAYELLKENTIDINFVGNVEARDIPSGDVDVIVCDGFTGNVVLKLTEGVAMTMFSMLKSAFTKNAVTKLGALLSKGGLMDMKKRLDYKEYGGAPFMGVDGCLIKAHGSSDSKAIMNAVRQAIAFNEGNVLENIKSSLRKIREDENDES